MRLPLANSFMTWVMLAIFVVLVAIASGYPANARFMPFVVGIPAIVLCVLQLVLDWRERRAPAPPRPPDAQALPGAAPLSAGLAQSLAAAEPEPALTPRETLRREAVLWAYFLALLGGVLLFGFWPTIPLFLVAFLRFQAGASWGLTLALSIAATLVLYLGLEQGFGLELHPGFATEYIGDLIGRKA